jgi:hypothetical protein
MQLDSAAHRIDDARKLGQQAVAGIFYGTAPVLLDLGINQLPEMRFEAFVRALLVHPLRRE